MRAGLVAFLTDRLPGNAGRLGGTAVPPGDQLYSGAVSPRRAASRFRASGGDYRVGGYYRPAAGRFANRRQPFRFALATHLFGKRAHRSSRADLGFTGTNRVEVQRGAGAGCPGSSATFCGPGAVDLPGG